jgi:hypothetical protein
MFIVDITALFLVNVILIVVICLVLFFYYMLLLLVLLINCISANTKYITKQLAFN